VLLLFALLCPLSVGYIIVWLRQGSGESCVGTLVAYLVSRVLALKQEIWSWMDMGNLIGEQARESGLASSIKAPIWSRRRFEEDGIFSPPKYPNARGRIDTPDGPHDVLTGAAQSHPSMYFAVETDLIL
jgi:hypothetical protein